jgi:uncharacterized protein
VSKIVISYRRSDSDVFAGRIRDRLAGRYGDASVFMDVDDIPFGIDFREHIKEALAASDVVLVIIGSRWLGIAESGLARIQDDTDPVRIEIETVLQNGTSVIPVLVGDTEMPKPAQLPESLKNFAFLNAASVDTGRDFHPHMERLLRSIDRILEKRNAPPRRDADKATSLAERAQPFGSRRNRLAAVLLLGLLVVAGVGFASFSFRSPESNVAVDRPEARNEALRPAPPTATTENLAAGTLQQAVISAPPSPAMSADGAARAPEPSFSCQDARRPVELAICQDADLARKDRALIELTDFLKGRRPSDDKLKREHAAWLESRDQCRGDGMRTCIDNAYDAQIAKLRMGPSFNCLVDRHRVEQAICADAVLSTKDQVMSDWYSLQRGRRPPEVRQALLDEQRRWIAVRNACEQPDMRACINRAYDSRLADLDRLAATR